MQLYKDLDKIIKRNHLEKLCKKRILITGATGLIGSNIAEIIFYLNYKYASDNKLYLAGRDFRRIESRFSYGRNNKFQFVEFDASTGIPPLVDDDFDFIIHAAGNVHPAAYAKFPVETMLCNFLGLNSLYKIANKQTRICYVSSSEVYGILNSNEPHKEDEYGYIDLLNVRSAYVNSKRASETLCVSYSDEFNVECVIVRPGHIYGPFFTSYDTKASAQFIRSAIAGENIVMKSKGEQIRSYCYSYDCAAAVLISLLNGQNCGAYNISNPSSVCSIRDFALELADISGIEVIYEEPSEEEKKGYTPIINSSLNASKLLDLGWNPCFTLREGLKRSVEFNREGVYHEI